LFRKTVAFWLRGERAPAGGEVGAKHDLQVVEFAKSCALHENFVKFVYPSIEFLSDSAAGNILSEESFVFSSS
jgi:hypothetical protein